MPRKPRFNLIGIPQHVIQRGNNREPCFYAEEDYRRYLNDLQKAAKKHHCHIHAYVLMTNHVHLLVTPMIDHGIPQMMQALGRRYVYYTKRHPQNKWGQIDLSSVSRTHLLSNEKPGQRAIVSNIAHC